MPSVSVPTALAVGGVASAGASLIGSSNSADAAKQAAATQAAAADQASNNQMTQFQQTRDSLQPFINYGQSATGWLKDALPSLVNPFTPGDLTQTPGYKFTLDQGLKSTQNSYAAQGLANSGAALKGAANYAEGLAGTTYNQQLQNYLAQNQQRYSLLAGGANLGENAAAGVGALGQQATTNAGNFSTSGAASTAAGTVGAANAVNAGISGVGNAVNSGIGNYALYQALQGGGMFGNVPGSVSAVGAPSNSGVY